MAVGGINHNNAYGNNKMGLINSNTVTNTNTQTATTTSNFNNLNNLNNFNHYNNFNIVNIPQNMTNSVQSLASQSSTTNLHHIGFHNNSNLNISSNSVPAPNNGTPAMNKKASHTTRNSEDSHSIELTADFKMADSFTQNPNPRHSSTATTGLGVANTGAIHFPMPSYDNGSPPAIPEARILANVSDVPYLTSTDNSSMIPNNNNNHHHHNNDNSNHMNGDLNNRHVRSTTGSRSQRSLILNTVHMHQQYGQAPLTMFDPKHQHQYQHQHVQQQQQQQHQPHQQQQQHYHPMAHKSRQRTRMTQSSVIHASTIMANTSNYSAIQQQRQNTNNKCRHSSVDGVATRIQNISININPSHGAPSTANRNPHNHTPDKTQTHSPLGTITPISPFNTNSGVNSAVFCTPITFNSRSGQATPGTPPTPATPRSQSPAGTPRATTPRARASPRSHGRASTPGPRSLTPRAKRSRTVSPRRASTPRAFTSPFGVGVGVGGSGAHGGNITPRAGTPGPATPELSVNAFAPVSINKSVDAQTLSKQSNGRNVGFDFGQNSNVFWLSKLDTFGNDKFMYSFVTLPVFFTYFLLCCLLYVFDLNDYVVYFQMLCLIILLIICVIIGSKIVKYRDKMYLRGKLISIEVVA